ncbi:MFS transporter [Dethiothermospora halolimnae]|uniref:MFS transporter n=1 Tax=Dethiothermospora halolimnae TaxID=3114390 RepID=UPI003CCBC0C2
MTKVNNQKEYNRRWAIWGILAIAYVIVFFHRVAVGVVREELISDFGIGDVQFGNIGAMYFYAYMLMQIPCGILADTLGARKTVTLGVLFAGIGSIIFSVGQTIAFAYVGRLIVGLGVSVVFVSTLKVLSNWFREEEFGKMSGFTSFIGNGGALLAQFPLAFLVGLIGWRLSFAGIGAVTIVVGILIYIIVRNKPEDVGLRPIMDEEGNKDINIGESIKSVFLNIRTWPSFFAFGGMFGSVIAFMGQWGTPYMQHVYNISKAKASTFPMAVTIGLMIGSLAVGTISDRIGKRKKPFLIFSLAYFCTWVVLLFVNPGNMPFSILYILLFMMGFTAAGFILSWACAKEVNLPRYAGMSTGTANMGGFLFAAIIQPLIGYILNNNFTGEIIEGTKIYSIDDYNKGFLVCIVAIVISIISILFIKETNCKNIVRK